MTELFELPMVAEAVVSKKGAPCGRLARTAHGVVFEYDDGYAGPSVATTLPVGATSTPPLGGGGLPPFFSGLLPEGRRLTAIRRAVKTSADDELSLLMAIGEDTVGDVQVRPPGGLRRHRPTPLDWGQVRLRELFERAVGPDPERVGLPGVQDKISGRMIAWPEDLPQGHVIIKLNPPEFPGLVENEAFFLGAARGAGLQVPGFDLVVDAAGEAGLVTHRFDRSGAPGGEVVLLGQEDGCQVLARYPADKYALDLADVVAGLADVTGAPAVGRFRLFEQIVFAYLIGNGDQHAKNLAVIEHAGEWRVSPVYDTPSSYPYGDTTLALPFLGDRGISDIPRHRWLELADRIELPRPAAERVIGRLVDAVPGWISRCDELPYDDRRIHKMRRFLAYRADLLTS